MTTEEAQKFASSYDCEYTETSAKTGEGVTEMMESMFEKVLTSEDFRENFQKNLQKRIAEATDEIVQDVDDSDVFELLDASKDFALRHTAVI